MKLFSTDAQDAIEAGATIVSGAVEILCDPVFRVWGGYGDLTIGSDTFTGIGHKGLVQVSGGAIGSAASAITLTLSGIDPDVLLLLDADGARGSIATLWRLIFDGTGRTLLDAHVFDRGKVDTIATEETVGGTAAITANVETAARALGRRGGRMRTDADQRLIKSNDGAFKAISYAGSKQVYWGGPVPAMAGSVLGGVGAYLGRSIGRYLPF